jgi:predicted nucleic acid-binding protein
MPPFADTNVLLYLLSADQTKADVAELLLAGRVIVSLQVLNEFAHVARRKSHMPWPQITELLALLRQRCDVRPLTLAVHESALLLVQRHALAWYDALIVAAALDAGCDTLYSEDMQDGLRIASALTIRNPFAAD